MILEITLSYLRLSHEYLHHNNLYANSELNADTHKKGYFGKSGRVRAQRFRGEISNGYVAEIHSLDFIEEVDVSEIVFNVRDEFTHINGIKICEKYAVPQKGGYTPRTRITQIQSAMFAKHWDTKQLMRELDSIPDGAVCYIEEKVHGTSGRTGNMLCITRRGWKFWRPKQEWRIISGTRRVDNIDFHISRIRKEIEHKIAPRLHKGEEVFYEIYGYDGCKQIQSGYPYDCTTGEYKAILYRVTINTPDGFCIDLNREHVYRRADELGMKIPFVINKLVWQPEADSLGYLLSVVKGKSNLDVGTLLEGVVIWFMDKKGDWTCLKHKSEEFLLEQDKRYENNQTDVEDNL